MLCAGLLIVAAAEAPAQDKPKSNPPQATEQFDLFGSIARWFEETAASIDSSLKDTRSKIDNFNREAGIAAKTTAGAAKDAADAVARLPNTRVVTGHENCVVAANGAPDCVAAANKLCKAKGFNLGKSVDATAAEECPAAVMLGRRPAQPGECKTVTFVTRAVCQ